MILISSAEPVNGKGCAPEVPLVPLVPLVPASPALENPTPNEALSDGKVPAT
jgi:hypothetical protein